ncbi:MAG: NAD(P)-dependent oxidoreductase [SAR202 cluster bacterium]|nr:NAD(P)-dependent oxidoreductase [SAR202 cluster bacterium]
MRVLVTGVTGSIGANLAAALVKEGHSVRGLVWQRDPRVEKLRPLNFELVNGTVTNVEDVKRAVDGVDAVYHLAAAFQGGGPFTTEEYFEINVRGVFNMLEAAKANPKLKHFIMASTDSVYAKSAPGGMSELVHRTAPRSRWVAGTAFQKSWARTWSWVTTTQAKCLRQSSASPTPSAQENFSSSPAST